MIDPFVVYKQYLAIRTHFNNWEYDYFQYRGTTPCSMESYEKRKDKHLFQALAKKRWPFEMLLSNLSVDPSRSIKDILSDQDSYIRYRRQVQSLTYMFTQEIKKLDLDLMSNLTAPKGEHPKLMRQHLAGRVSLETGTILLHLTGHSWKEAAQGDLLFNDVALRMMKYNPFLRYNEEKFRRIIVDTFINVDKYMEVA